MFAASAPLPAAAETLRLATFNTELSRAGPGLLLRDILRGDDAQVLAVAQVIAASDPDILVLQGVDYDAGLVTLSALRDVIRARGAEYPHIFALMPNAGIATGLDLDGDGRLGQPRDAQGFGRFAGEGGMAILSRVPIVAEGVQDFSTLLWRDLPGALLRTDAGTPHPDGAALEVQRLSSQGHWVIALKTATGRAFTLLVFHATPPVFDGPEDRNGRRNHDEVRFWSLYMDQAFGPVVSKSFAIIGDANIDPDKGEGRKSALRALLNDPRLQDPRPVATRAGTTAQSRHDTVDWRDPVPGDMRVDYILPSADLTVVESAVVWPDPPHPLAGAVVTASRHRLVWVDLSLPAP